MVPGGTAVDQTTLPIVNCICLLGGTLHIEIQLLPRRAMMNLGTDARENAWTLLPRLLERAQCRLY
jgi:hypothetical protein